MAWRKEDETAVAQKEGAVDFMLFFWKVCMMMDMSGRRAVWLC